MHPKSVFIGMLVALSVAALFPLLVIVTVDPYHQYHKSFFKNHYADVRRQFSSTAGRINSYLGDPDEGFDSVVVGVSTANAYVSGMMEDAFGWRRTMNLSLAGGNPDQNQVLLEKILKISSVKHVFIELTDHYVLPSFSKTDRPFFGEDDPFDPRLYDETIFNDQSYLFDAGVFFDALNIVVGKTSDYQWPVDAPVTKEYLMQFDYVLDGNLDGQVLADRLGVFNKLKHGIDTKFSKGNGVSDFDGSRFDLRLVRILMGYCNKNIDIVLNFSPLPAMEWIVDDDSFLQLNLRRYAVEAFAGCKNIRIYAADQYPRIINRPDSFLDNVHFSMAIARFMLKEIAAGRSRLDASNISVYEQQVIANIKRLDIDLEILLQTPVDQRRCLSLDLTC